MIFWYAITHTNTAVFPQDFSNPCMKQVRKISLNIRKTFSGIDSQNDLLSQYFHYPCMFDFTGVCKVVLALVYQLQYNECRLQLDEPSVVQMSGYSSGDLNYRPALVWLGTKLKITDRRNKNSHFNVNQLLFGNQKILQRKLNTYVYQHHNGCFSAKLIK